MNQEHQNTTVSKNQTQKSKKGTKLRPIFLAILLGIVLTGASALIINDDYYWKTHGYPAPYFFTLNENYNEEVRIGEVMYDSQGNSYELGMLGSINWDASIWGLVFDIIFWSAIVYIVLIFRRFRWKKSGESGNND